MGRLFAPSKQTSSSRVNLPEWADRGFEAIGTRAQDLMNRPYQPFWGQRVAGMSDWTTAGAGAVQSAAGYQPGQVSAPMVSAPGAVQPRMVQAGQVAPGSVSAERVTPGSLAGRSLSAYQDPYQQQVIDAAMSDIDRSTRVAQAGRAAGGVQAAGFGGFGDRASVAAAEVERAGIDAKARTAAGLRSQGFQRAQDMAVADINRDFQSQGQNAEMGLRAGLANQQTGLAGQQFNVQAGMQAGMANQQAGLTADQFSAGQQMQAGLANQQAGQRAQEFNVQSGMQGAAMRANAGQTLAGLGEIDRGVRQAGLDFDYQQFREGRDDPFLKTQWAAGVLGGAAAPYSANVTQTTPGPSPFSQIAGAALTGASIYAMSEPGEKTDKRRVGTDPATGLGIWSYRYKGDPKRYPKVVGPMADEVEERYPHLVHRVANRRVVDMAGLEALRGGLGDAPGYADGGSVDGGWPSWLRPRQRSGAEPPLIQVPFPWARPTRPDLPPIIEGVAEPIPVTDAYNPMPPIPGMGGRGIGFRESEDVTGGIYVGEGLDGVPPAAPLALSMDGLREGAMAAAGPAPEAPIVLPPSVERSLARLRAAQGQPRAGAAGPVFPGETPPHAMPDAVPYGGAPAPTLVSATSGAARSAGGAGESADGGQNWLRRFADRLVDPDYAGPQAMMQAGLAMMASRNPNWAGAIGEGASVGMQVAERARERARPMAEQRRQTREFQDLLRGMGEGTAVSPPLAPRRPGEGSGPERAPRMTSVAVPGGVEPPAELRPAFDAASRETGIPVSVLVAMARQESNFNPAAVGRAGEVGVMQILPSTARAPTGMAGVDPEALRDPAANIMFGARYLRARAGEGADLSQPEVLARALRAYNGGGDPDYVRNVQRWMPPAAGGAGAPERAGGGSAPRAAPEQPQGEPRVQMGGRWFSRSDLLTLAAALPGNEQAQRFVQLGLPMLNAEVARRENAADRALARQENADLRRDLAAGRAERPTPTELSRLQAERDALPAGHPDRASYDAAIRRASGEAADTRVTPTQVVQLRRDANIAARQEAERLEFDTEQDRTGWITQRARDLVAEWGVPDGPAGSSGAPTIPLAGSARPDAVAADGQPRVAPRRPSPRLSDTARTRLGAVGEASAIMPALSEGFQDDYGGFGSAWVGNTANLIARNTPGESPRADWWARYYEQANVIRNQLFGSALTRTEAEAFERQSINPGMTGEMIRSRLREQANAARRAAYRLAQSYIEEGYNRRAVEAALGIRLPEEPPPAPGAGAVSGEGRGQPGRGTGRGTDGPPPPPARGGQQRPPLESFLEN